MKSERRHELQHNDLAEWILKSYEGIAPYKNTILGVTLLVIVLAISISLWHSHNLSQSGEAWGSLGVPVFQPIFADDRTIPEMERTVQNYPRQPAAEWAAVFAGDTCLMMGTNRIMTNKVGAEYQTQKRAAIEMLKQALDRYNKALETLTIPGAREQAMFGKARAVESLIDNETKPDEAIAAYEDLNKAFPNGMFKALAIQRLEQLKKPDTLKFYTALARYVPKPKVESPRSPLGNLSLPDEPLEPTTPVRPDAPKTEVPKNEPPKPPAAKPDAAKPEPSKTETPKAEPAKRDAPKAAGPKTETPKAEAPKSEAPKSEAPKTDAPKPEAPKADAAKKDK
jgi:hypothetical protein